jgi:hypothetical protein
MYFKAQRLKNLTRIEELQNEIEELNKEIENDICL